jgi:hypothetical protein
VSADIELEEIPRIETPAEVDIALTCPTCGVTESVGVKLTTRLVVERGAASKLSLRVRSLGLEHVCGQATLDLLPVP